MGLLARRFHGQLGDASDTAGLVASIAGSAGVDPVLVMAMIDVESSFNATATHRDADGGISCGLMQLRTETASSLAGRPVSCAELSDPAFNITLGVQYLAQQLARYYGNASDAVAAYNGGSARKNTSGQYVNTKGVPNVQAYVDKVMAAYPRYQTAVDTTVPTDPSATDPTSVDGAPAFPDLTTLFPADWQLPTWWPYAAVGAVGLLVLMRR